MPRYKVAAMQVSSFVDFWNLIFKSAWYDPKQKVVGMG